LRQLRLARLLDLQCFQRLPIEKYLQTIHIDHRYQQGNHRQDFQLDVQLATLQGLHTHQELLPMYQQHPSRLSDQ
jgi:hypothetical protein